MDDMTDLDALVPPHEPAEDTLAFAGKAALSLVPVVGPLAAETLAHALETRQAERQHEFNVAIAQALTDAISRLDEAATIEDIVGSDEFIAAVTRAQRAAAETASHHKRQRLAAAIANGGSWAPFSASEREQFTRLVDEFDELHVWLLHYFTDPTGWLQSRDLYAQHANLMMGGIDGPLGTALGVPAECLARTRRSGRLGPRPDRACLDSADHDDDPAGRVRTAHVREGATIPRVHQ